MSLVLADLHYRTELVGMLNPRCHEASDPFKSKDSAACLVTPAYSAAAKFPSTASCELSVNCLPLGEYCDISTFDYLYAYSR